MVQFFGSSVTYIRNQKVGIALTEIKNPHFFLYLEQVIDTLVNQKCSVTILDIEKWASKKARFSSLVAKSGSSLPSEGLEGLRNEFITLMSEKTGVDVLHVPIILRKSFPKKIDLKQIWDCDYYPPQLKTSVSSIFMTKYSRSLDTSSNLIRHRKVLAILVNSFLITYESLMRVDENFDSVIYINGRKPDQAACRFWAQERGMKSFSLEHAMQPYIAFHFEEFIPQNFLGYQLNFIEKYSKSPLALEENSYASIKWFQNQRINSPTFGPKFESHQLNQFDRKSRTFVIYTSSLSEFDFAQEALDQEWNQLKALKKTVEKIRGEYSDAQIILRIHPNQRNYAWKDLVRIIDCVRGHGVKIVLPWDHVSSYELMDLADYIITWNSTIGLEGIYHGKKVICLSENFYHLITEVPLLNSSTITDFNFDNAKYAHPKSAINAMSLILFNGEPLNQEKYDLSRYSIAQRTVAPAKFKRLVIRLNHLLSGEYVGRFSRPVLHQQILTRLVGSTSAIYILSMTAVFLARFRGFMTRMIGNCDYHT